MKVYDVVQGSAEWHKIRAGVVTASGLDHLLTPVGLKPSTQREKYLNRLIAERLLGGPLESDDMGGWAERGLAMEQEAAAWYEWEAGSEAVTKVGFAMNEDLQLGCSPDRFVGEAGGVDFKVPAAHTHVAYLRDPDKLTSEYRGQIQGCLLATGRAWWDILSYNPRLPCVLVRVLPDEEYRRALLPVLAKFNEELMRTCEALGSKMGDAPVMTNPFA